MIEPGGIKVRIHTLDNIKSVQNSRKQMTINRSSSGLEKTIPNEVNEENTANKGKRNVNSLNMKTKTQRSECEQYYKQWKDKLADNWASREYLKTKIHGTET